MSPGGKIDYKCMQGAPSLTEDDICSVILFNVCVLFDLIFFYILNILLVKILFPTKVFWLKVLCLKAGLAALQWKNSIGLI